jgi:hypothetical protein
VVQPLVVYFRLWLILHARSQHALQGYSIPEKYKAIQTYIGTLSKIPAWQKSLPTDGDASIEAGWKAKVSSGWSH